MVQTRSQTRSIQEGKNNNQEEKTIQEGNCIMVNCIKVNSQQQELVEFDDDFFISTSIPYLTEQRVKHDVMKIGEIVSLTKRKEAIYLLFKKLCISLDLPAMYNKQFLKTLVLKIMHLNHVDYDTFSEFLLPLFQHIHTVCNSKMKKFVSMDEIFSDETDSTSFEYIIIKSLCVSNKTDTLYMNILDSLYVKGKIDLYRFEKIVNCMLNSL